MSTEFNLETLLANNNIKIEPAEPEADGDLRRWKDKWTFVLAWGVLVLMGCFLAGFIWVSPNSPLSSQALNALIGLFAGGISFLLGRKVR